MPLAAVRGVNLYYELHGESGGPLALAEEVGFERFHLLGHSMGGGVVQEIALRSPQKLLSLTLHDTSCRFRMSADPEIAAWWERRLHLAETQGMAAVAEEEPPFPPPPHMPA